MATILVVDDAADVRKAICALVEELGHEVTAADSGLKALSLIGAKPFGVALVDVYMPGMDGLELIPKLRFQSPGTKVIAMSGGYLGRGLDLLRAAQRAGADRVLTKPFTLEELRHTLDQVS